MRSVLVVDDSSLIRRLMRVLLTDSGWAVSEATNGAEGILKAQEVHPDVIILDCAMPVMNGLEAARELRRLMPAVPILMFSTYADPMLTEIAVAAGCQKVIGKSDGISAVLSALRSLTAAA